MSDWEDWAAEVVEDCEARSPEILDLAAAISLASRVEPLLLRRARLELCPWVHAGAEADLWYSPLVQVRSPKAMVFSPAVAHRLQRKLAEPGRRPGVDEAYNLLREVHAEAPESVRLEEEITWRALRAPDDPEIPALLRKAVRSLVEGQQTGLAEWAARALPRLPPEIRRIPEAWLLSLAASARLGGLALLAGPMPDGILGDDLFWAARSAKTISVYLTRDGSALFLSLQPGEAETAPVSVPAPLTHPVLLEVTPEQGEPRLVFLQPGGPPPDPIPLETGTLRLRTASGEVFRVEIPVVEMEGAVESGAPRLELSPFQSMGALPPGSPVFVGRREILNGILDGLEQGLSFLVVGPRQIGKTSLLNRIAHELQDRPSVQTFYLDCQGVRRGQDLLPRLLDLLGEERAWEGAESPHVLKIFNDLITRAQRSGRLPVVLINEIDSLVIEDPPFLGALRGSSDEAGVRFVITGFNAARQAAEEGVFRHWVHGLGDEPAVVLGPLEHEAALELLDQLERPGLGFRWGYQARNPARELILERTYRLPWLLQALCFRLVQVLAESGRGELTLDDVSTVLDSYPRLWETLESQIEGASRALGRPAAALAVRFALHAFVIDRWLSEAGPAPFDARQIPSIVFDALSRLSIATPESERLRGYLADFPFRDMAFLLSDVTLLLRRRVEPSEPSVEYSFFEGIYPKELLREVGGYEGVMDRLISLALELAVALKRESPVRSNPFTTASVDPSAPETPRVLWGKDGRCWRLEELSPVLRAERGSAPELLSAERLLEGRLLILAGEVRSGLRSFLNWVRWISETEKATPFRFVLLDAHRIATEVEDLADEALGAALAGQLRKFSGRMGSAVDELFRKGERRVGRMLELYERIFGRELPLVLALAGLEALSQRARVRLLGGLRSFVEGYRFRGRLIVAVSKLEVLDPDPNVSPLLGMAAAYRPPVLTRDEIASLWERFGSGSGAFRAVADGCFEWTGGQPLLVQRYLSIRYAQSELDSDRIGNRLRQDSSAEEVWLWQQDLAAILLEDPEARRFLERLTQGHVSSAFETSRSWRQLFVSGWIRHDERDPSRWVIRSRAHSEWVKPVLKDLRGFLPGEFR
ncbi:MAG TPA: ATP-binding protein [Thermoanaerobaculia bacterium]